MVEGALLRLLLALAREAVVAAIAVGSVGLETGKPQRLMTTQTVPVLAAAERGWKLLV